MKIENAIEQTCNECGFHYAVMFAYGSGDESNYFPAHTELTYCPVCGHPKYEELIGILMSNHEDCEIKLKRAFEFISNYQKEQEAE